MKATPCLGWLSIVLLLFGNPCADDEAIVTETTLRCPHTLGLKPIRVRKAVDPRTGACRIESDQPGIRSYADLARVEQAELRARRRVHGRLSTGLIALLNQPPRGVRVPVRIFLRRPVVKHPSRFHATAAELRAHSQSLLSSEPVVSPLAFAERNDLEHVRMSQGSVLDAYLRPETIRALAFDPDVAAVEPGLSVHPAGDGVVLLEDLARSALNPYAHPADKLGNQVIAGMLEATGSDHANQVAECIASAAPLAYVARHPSAYYDSAGAEAWLVDWEVQTVSVSLSRDPGLVSVHSHEFMVMDDFAYRWPCPFFASVAGNSGYQAEVMWQSYGALCVGSVKHWEHAAYVFDTFTNTRNPEPEHGACPPDDSACAGDRELPEILAPGSHPLDPPGTGPTHLWTMDTLPLYCSVQDDPDSSYICGWYYDQIWQGHGTSYSAPIVNGIGARLISSRRDLFQLRPDAVKMALLLTAHNVEGNYWSSGEDQRDGAGVVSAHDAIEYASSLTDLSGQDSVPAVERGFFTAQADSSMQDRFFRVRIPTALPPNRHLRVALVWTSIPDFEAMRNTLSDLDIGAFVSDDGTFGSYSLDASVEMFDVPAAQLTPGSDYTFTLFARDIRIPPSGCTDFFYYTLGWTWVRDHADTLGVATRRPEASAAEGSTLRAMVQRFDIKVVFGPLKPDTRAHLVLYGLDGREIRVSNVGEGDRAGAISLVGVSAGTYVCALLDGPRRIAAKSVVVAGRK